MKSFDLRQFRVITLEDVENAVKAGATIWQGAEAVAPVVDGGLLAQQGAVAGVHPHEIDLRWADDDQ